MSEQKKQKVCWASDGKTELTEDQYRAFDWLIKLFKKKPEELTDPEKQAQKIYKNLIVFTE